MSFNDNLSNDEKKKFNQFANPEYAAKQDELNKPRRYKGKHILLVLVIIGALVFGVSLKVKAGKPVDDVTRYLGLSKVTKPQKIDWLTTVLVTQNLQVGSQAQSLLIQYSSRYNSFGGKAGTIVFDKNGLTWSRMDNAQKSQTAGSTDLTSGPGRYNFGLPEKVLSSGVGSGVLVSGTYNAGNETYATSDGTKVTKPVWCMIVKKDGVSSIWSSKTGGLMYTQIGGEAPTCPIVEEKR